MPNSTKNYTPDEINGGMQNGFIGFMMNNRGKNSGEVLQQMLSSGQYSQEQLNIAQQAKARLEQQFSGLRSMFHF